MKVLLTVFSILLTSCGAELRQTQAVDGSASIEVRISISFPECADIQNEELRVECIKTAAEIIISVNGGLSEEQQAIIDELNGEDSEEE